jgi:hypothetical protein
MTASSTLSMYQASVPVFVRALGILSRLLYKAASHVEQQQLDPQELLSARLFEDMYPLTAQIQRASDAAKFGAARLAAIQPPAFVDEESSFYELQERIINTIAFLDTLQPQQFDGSAQREIILKVPTRELHFIGQSYLLTFALPNFLFHVTTAYDILRHKGVPVGKMDYLGY